MALVRNDEPYAQRRVGTLSLVRNDEPYAQRRVVTLSLVRNDKPYALRRVVTLSLTRRRSTVRYLDAIDGARRPRRRGRMCRAVTVILCSIFKKFFAIRAQMALTIFGRS